jgi:hypothetical protein
VGFSYQKLCTYTAQFEKTVACNWCTKKWQRILKSCNILSLYFSRPANIQGHRGIAVLSFAFDKTVEMERWPVQVASVIKL